MQNYKSFLSTLAPFTKSFKDSVSAVTKLRSSVLSNADKGNLTQVKKSLDAVQAALAQVQEKTDALQAEVSAFDVQSYFVSSEFEQQLLEACKAKGINVKGEKGTYEMFPYKVRILGDADHAPEVYLNRKKANSVNPEYIADIIFASIDRLSKTSFNAAAFMEELAWAYEVTCLRAGARLGSAQSLNKIYENLTPMKRSRRDYDSLAFASDLSRLYEAGTEAWKTKKATYDFGPSRDGKSGIRVVSRTGIESYISTMSMMNKE